MNKVCNSAATIEVRWRLKTIIGLLLAWVSPIAAFANDNHVKFSHSGGFYEQSFALSLTCQDGYSIHYTTNGNEHKLTDPQYQSPLWLDEKLFSNSKIIPYRHVPMKHGMSLTSSKDASSFEQLLSTPMATALEKQ